MKKYEFLECMDRSLLVEENQEQWTRKVVDQGLSYSKLEDNIFYLEKSENGGVIYIFNENMNEIARKIENVFNHDYERQGEYVILCAGVDYYLTDTKGKVFIELGSWFQNNVFIKKEEALIKTCFFIDDEPVFREYESVEFLSEESGIMIAFGCIKEALDEPQLFEMYHLTYENDSPIGEDLNLENYIDRDDIRLDADIDEAMGDVYGKIRSFLLYKDTGKYISVFEGYNLIEFDNAILFKEDDGKFKLYGIVDYKLVLWGEGQEADWDDYSVTIDMLRWDAEENNWRLLKNNPYPFEPQQVTESKNEPKEELQQEPEPESEPLLQKENPYQNVVLPAPGTEKKVKGVLRVGSEDSPRRKKNSFLSWWKGFWG